MKCAEQTEGQELLFYLPELFPELIQAGVKLEMLYKAIIVKLISLGFFDGVNIIFEKRSQCH